MSSSSPGPRRSFGSLWLILAAILLAVCIAFVAFYFPQKNQQNDVARRPKDQGGKLSAESSRKLIGLRNRSIGHLENHEFAKAEEALTEIIRDLPDDLFGRRNLAICRQITLETIDRLRTPDEYAKSMDLAQQAIAESKAKEPASFIPWVISSRVAAKAEQTESGLSDLREAIRLAPQAVGPAYDLFLMLQSTPGDKSQDESYQALKSVYEQEPRNLFVLKDWLPILAQRQSREFTANLKQAQSTLTPFVELIKVHTRIDLNQAIETALQDAADGNWAKVQRSMTILKNVIVSEAARDKRYVMLDSLEYMLFDFSPETHARFEQDAASSTLASKPVHFLEPEDSSKWPAVENTETAKFSVVDFDLDGRPDVIVLQSGQITAWGQQASDSSWTTIANVAVDGAFVGIALFDLDDDVDPQIKGLKGPEQGGNSTKVPSGPNANCHSADPDVLLFGPDGLKLLENVKNSETKLRTLVAKAGGEEFDAVREVRSIEVADFDSDGDLDLIASTSSGLRIFSNRGNLTFEETTSRSQLPPSSKQVVALAFVDWDRDTDIDLLLAFSEGAGLLENVRHGQFRYRDLAEFSALQQANSVLIADFDGNSSWDVAVTSDRGAKVVLTNRTSAGIVAPQQTISLTSVATRWSQSGDFDNDGFLDLILAHEDGSTIFSGRDAGAFVEADPVTNEACKQIRSLAVADLDRDGDLDFIVPQNGRIACLTNQCRESDNPNNGSIEIQLVGERYRPGEQNYDKRVNHVNLGGVIEMKSGDHYQARIVSGPSTHFGLGAQRPADLARILWTNGIPTNLMSPAPHESVCIEQKLQGSCPYLYAWNGEQFEFVTDLLWNAPLGLKFAERIVAPWREWEYLKIEGRQLKPRDGHYQLRITAELWEAEYFDQCKLFAIDHPAGTEVYTNEKVGPAELAFHKIHTVRSPRTPVAARDSKGRNILDQITARDGSYTRTFDRRLAQGFTEEHFLELDLGDFDAAKPVTLFLTGWMYPGSTSLRVQLSQNPELPVSRAPSLWVPDASGEWREVRPFMGFPGGKTKTIAVDLSDLFSGGDHRLRIVSTMEIYWDHAFFTVDEEPVEFHQTELSLVRAELVDRRGVSFRSWPDSGNGPDQFDYSRLMPGEHWPAMSGKFTRFGDVTELLTVRDDQLVVIGSGDEIQLAFAETADRLPEGWVRDFVIFTVGWDKDADQNTVYGDMVEPLPFEGMTDYAHVNGQSRPLDQGYVRYLEQYQTRTRNPNRFWKRGIQSTDSK